MEETLTTPRLFTKLPTYDTGEWRAAMVYAQALVGAAQKAGALENVRAEFDSLIDDVLDRLPKLESVLTSTFVEEDAKEAMLKKAFSKSASPTFLNFLQVLVRHGRINMLRLIHFAFHEEYNKAHNRTRVFVSTAEPLDAKAEQTIVDACRQRLNMDAVLEKKVSPELIGGLVLRVGDRVFDGSIATQLKQLREQMVTRSMHEIQSRRDRFSTAS
jgi:F-type H+-transporting ATPase subunit delta